MRISIWDLDWYHKMSFVPNYRAQKISSYYKQQGYLINFIEKEEHIHFEYDIIYILREKKSTPMPPIQYIDQKNVRLIGKEFKYYDNQFDLTMEMDMVRPDYLLYDIPEGNAYANAHILKLTHGGKLLPARQDHVNYHVKYSQKTLVVDEDLWDLSKDDLKNVLEELIAYKNIAFSFPIKLKMIFSDTNIRELFDKLNFMAGTIIEFRNNHSSELEEVKKIVDLAENLKAKNSRIKIRPVPIKAVIYNHWRDKSKGIEDLKRLLQIADYAKEKEVDIIIKTPNKRLTTPYWYFFDSMEVWTSSYFYLSYIESMVASRTVRTKEQWFEPINDSIKWSTPRIYFLIHLLTEYPEILLKHGLLKTKEEKLDISFIDIDEIIKFKNKEEQLETFKKIEKEFSKEVNI